MLKTIRLETSSVTSAGFAYKLFGDKCVFTALDSGSQGSSINSAEKIAFEIANQEGKNTSDLRFFDLQTSIAYGRLSPDLFEFEEVIVIPSTNLLGFVVGAWRLVECPQEVIEAFSMFLGDRPRQHVPRAFEAQFQ